MNRRKHIDSFWYENDKQKLIEQIKWSISHKFGPQQAHEVAAGKIDSITGIVSPHAGFVCSAPFAALAFDILKKNAEKPDSIVILGPNHTGMGKAIAIFPTPGNWETPLGELPIDEEIAVEIAKLTNQTQLGTKIEFDSLAHIEEHSIDNQIPFIQYFFNTVPIIPICILDQRTKTCQFLGKILAEVIKKNREKKRIVLVASSDFTHYVPHQQALTQDAQVIEALIAMNIEEAVKRKEQLDVTACGFGPILALFSAAKELGKAKGYKLGYGTSGLTCSSPQQVVGYGALAV